MRYRVVGDHVQDGVAPGGYVHIDDERRARRLVRAGHLAPPGHLCDVCGREFKTAGGLSSHQRTHEETA